MKERIPKISIRSDVINDAMKQRKSKKDYEDRMLKIAKLTGLYLESEEET